MNTPAAHEHDDQDGARAKERQSSKPDTEGASNRAPDVAVPFEPDSDEDSPLGDTDEHSDA